MVVPGLVSGGFLVAPTGFEPALPPWEGQSGVNGWRWQPVNVPADWVIWSSRALAAIGRLRTSCVPSVYQILILVWWITHIKINYPHV